MRREYLRVIPTSEQYSTATIAQTLASLHKLNTTESPSLAQRLNPFSDERPLTFEFLALSAGTDEPVEFYYGVDEHLGTLEKRLRAIYPESFDITRVEIDPLQRLLVPIEFSRDEFHDRVEEDRLFYEFDEAELGLEEHRSNERLNGEPNTDGGTQISEQAHRYDFGTRTVTLGQPATLRNVGALTQLTKPTLTDEGTILARPPVDEYAPIGIHWDGKGIRKRDWMTFLTPFSKVYSRSDNESTIQRLADEGRAPLSLVVDLLAESEHPIAYQVVFHRKDDWSSNAVDRQADLLAGRDTTGQKIADFLTTTDWSRSEDELTGDAKKRYEATDTKSSVPTFSANVRAIAVPTDESARQTLEQTFDTLRTAFDQVDGRFYKIHGERLRHTGIRKRTKEKRARRELDAFANKRVEKEAGKRRPELIVSGDELANFILLPSAGELTIEGTRGTRAEQQSRKPLPRPHQDLMREFRVGMAIGYALDENSEPEETPIHIPPSLLPTHYGRFGTTGSGKSKALINDMLSLYENTDGPVILIDPKGDGMSQNYMRAHARRFGTTDLEANVVHFPLPEVLPGFSFFNLEPSLANGRHRADAVQRKADHYEQILKLVMGEERYERATVAPTLIKTLIKALFDEEHGRENGLYREDVNYFGHRQLEHVVDQLWQAGPPNPREEEVPRSSDEEVRRAIYRQLQLDPNTFANVMGGVGNRLAYISQDTHLRRIFNNTESRFDFRDVLDENTVILFDLGDLRDEAARLMTGVILTNLDDALKERKRDLEQYPDDYVVNLLVDEAASVMVSDIMNDLLEKGRSFRLSVGLSMQFPEQMKAEGGRKVYLNALNNIGSSFVGKINVDRELARAMAHEEMDPVDFANRIRSLPRGEWIASLPSPTFGQTGPYPFSLKPLPIPAGHPESDYPLDDREEDRFQASLSTIHERTSDEFGVPETGIAPSEQSPEAVQEILGTPNQDLDQALAKTIRIIQLREGVRDENGWVAVEDVDAELRACFEGVDTAPPEYEVLADIRERSRLLDVDLDTATDELLVRLTDVGETAAAPDTGDVRASGSEAHDAALLEIEAALTALGFRVTILTQDGNERPDAKATHPDLDETFAIEAETTTPENPVKVLTNLRKAQDAEHVPLFVVRPGETETYWAERVEGILSPPVRQLSSGETRFYTHDVHITFSGGAAEQGGVTAVRPVTGETDSRRTVWTREDGELVLRDSDETEYARLSTLADASKDRFPAIYSYDHAADEYVVYEQGERHVYESKGAFEADWVRIKKPFIPEDEFSIPDYGHDSYVIVILPEVGPPMVYADETTHPVSMLLEERQRATRDDSDDLSEAQDRLATDSPTTTTDEQGADRAVPETGPNPSPDATDGGLPAFVERFVTEREGAVIPKDDLYQAYTYWTNQHEIEPKNKVWFARTLGDFVDYGTSRTRIDGERINCYTGVELTPEGGELLD
jgi:DNA helicase HerA-like ATPase